MGGKPITPRSAASVARCNGGPAGTGSHGTVPRGRGLFVRRLAVLCALVVCAASDGLAKARPDPEVAITQAEVLLNKGRFEKALKLLGTIDLGSVQAPDAVR